MKIVSCNACRFWERHQEPYPDNNRLDMSAIPTGYCRRRSPKHITNGFAKWPVTTNKDGCAEGFPL